MSISVQTSIASRMSSLSEQGSFRNAMYQQKQKRKEKEFELPRSSIEREEAPPILMETGEYRVHTAGLHHKISHIEGDMSMIQTAANALTQVEFSLSQMWDLMVLITNENEHNRALREADQDELEQLIKRINQVAEGTRYGSHTLLDGSHGVRGVATGEHLEFIGIDTDVPTSPVTGYEVYITQAATRSELRGRSPLTEDLVDKGEQLTLREGDVSNRFVTRKGESVSGTLERLSVWLAEHEIPLEVIPRPDAILHLRHRQYGSAYRFGASSLSPGILSLAANQIISATPGLDVEGTINGELCLGHGQFLNAPPDIPRIRGMSVRYTGTSAPADKSAGTVSVVQNAFCCQIGSPEPHIARLSVRSIQASDLGREVENASGFQSLQDIDIRTSKHVEDAMKVLEKSMKEVSMVKAKVELFGDQTLKHSLHRLQDEYGQLVYPAMFLQNSRNALAFAEQTRNKIEQDSGSSTLAQAYQNPQTVLSLLR